MPSVYLKGVRKAGSFTFGFIFDFFFFFLNNVFVVIL